jgi:DNA-binding MarR family transcriptional regulator
MCFALRKAARIVNRRYDSAVRTSGLRTAQLNLLVALEVFGAGTMTALAGRMGMERTTLTRNIAVLTSKGFVRVSRGDDLRSRRVAITPRGREAAIRALPAWRRAHTDLERSLGPKAFGDLSVLLRRLMQL